MPFFTKGVDRHISAYQYGRVLAVYATTREHIAAVAVDYAADAGLTIRYGLDHGALVFPPV